MSKICTECMEYMEEHYAYYGSYLKCPKCGKHAPETAAENLPGYHKKMPRATGNRPLDAAFKAARQMGMTKMTAQYAGDKYGNNHKRPSKAIKKALAKPVGKYEERDTKLTDIRNDTVRELNRGYTDVTIKPKDLLFVLDVVDDLKRQLKEVSEENMKLHIENIELTLGDKDD